MNIVINEFIKKKMKKLKDVFSVFACSQNMDKKQN